MFVTRGKGDRGDRGVRGVADFLLMDGEPMIETIGNLLVTFDTDRYTICWISELLFENTENLPVYKREG